jgi:hypothetical protein
MPYVRRSREQWKAIITQQQASGLSIAQFCREHHLKYSTFCARKYDIDNHIQHHRASHDVMIESHATSSRLVKVSTSSRTTSELMTITHQDVTLQLPLSVEPQWVVDVLRGLQS